MGPFLVDLANTVNSATPNVPLTPAEAALAVIRTAMTKADAQQEVHKAGINDARFDTLLAITGMPPAPVSLAEALRRGYITEADYELGISRGDLRNEYAPLMKRLAVQQASPAEVLNAAVEGQLAADVARAKFAEVGGEPDDYDWRLGTTGGGPGPVEAFAMASRGVIPWDGVGLGITSFAQAIAEGHTRNKWEPIYRAALVPIPPDRTLLAMYRAGGLTEEQFVKYLKMHGTSDEIISAFLTEATHTKTGAHKQLAESEVLALYSDQIIDRPTALAMTEGLGYNAAEADYIVEIAEFKAQAAALRTAVGRVHTLFVGHKIDASVATSILGELSVPPDRVTALLEVWAIEHKANVKILTEAQVVSAWGHAIIDTAPAIAELVKLGYDEADSTLLLAIHNKAALTPAQLAGNSGSQ